jgi:hypothetical protein
MIDPAPGKESSYDGSIPVPASFTNELRNKFIIYIGILMLVNIVLTTSVRMDPAQHLDGSTATEREIRSAALMTLTLTSVLIGSIVGLLVALFPFRGLRYGQKYLRASLLSILGIEALWLATTLIGLAMR